jgi:hypothetical protein
MHAGYPPPAYGQPYAAYPAGPTDGRAIAALVCSVIGLAVGVPLGIFCLGLPGLILGAIGLALGFSANQRIGESNGALRGRGLAMGGIVVGVVAVVISLIVLVIWIVGLAYSTTHPTPRAS